MQIFLTIQYNLYFFIVIHVTLYFSGVLCVSFMGVVGLLCRKKPSSISQSVVADERKTLGAAVSKKTQATDNKATTQKTGLKYKSSCCCINIGGDAVSETRRGSLVGYRPFPLWQQ